MWSPLREDAEHAPATVTLSDVITPMEYKAYDIKLDIDDTGDVTIAGEIRGSVSLMPSSTELTPPAPLRHNQHSAHSCLTYTTISTNSTLYSFKHNPKLRNKLHRPLQ